MIKAVLILLFSQALLKAETNPKFLNKLDPRTSTLTFTGDIFIPRGQNRVCYEEGNKADCNSAVKYQCQLNLHETANYDRTIEADPRKKIYLISIPEKVYSEQSLVARTLSIKDITCSNPWWADSKAPEHFPTVENFNLHFKDKILLETNQQPETVVKIKP
jgi:hypothetical protein